MKMLQNDKASRKRVQMYLFWILAVGSVLVNVKNIFTNFNVDSEYAIAMSYRLVRGDRMFLQMREPHQTSAFLMAAFIRLFLAVTGSTEWIAVYLNAVGCVLKGLVAGTIFHTFKKDVDQDALRLLCLFFFTVNPKNLLLPEYANMQVWFATLLICCLYGYLKQQKQMVFLLLAGICLCLDVLSYPSCVILYFAVLASLWKFSEKRGRDILLLSAECIGIGGGYLLFFAVKTGMGPLLTGMREIVEGDASHGSILQGDKWNGFMSEGLSLAAKTLVFAILSLAIVKAWTFLKKKRDREREKEAWMICFFAFFLVQDVWSILFRPSGYLSSVLYLPIFILAYYNRKKCNESERRILYLGALIGSGSFVAAALLTNLGLLVTLPFGVLFVAVCFFPICKSRYPMIGKWILSLFCAAVILRQGLIFRSETGGDLSILRLGGVIKSGPAKGIMSDYMGAYIANSTMEEWESYVQKGDRILLVGEKSLSTLGYLYQDTEISVDSTICTPTYNEKLLRYWESNPEKYPNFVAVDCWYGEFNISPDNWIFTWLEKEYQAEEVTDGKYWRYYIRRQ